MAIDFPNSPTLNQIYTVGSRSWIWDGSTWNIYANVPNRYIQDAAPSSPQSGDQWFESDTGRLFVYYDSAWVEIGNATDVAGALQPGQVTALSAVTSLTTDDVFPVVDNPSSATAASKITYGDLLATLQNSLPRGVITRATSQSTYTLTTTITQTTGMSVTFTAVANRLYRITYYEPQGQTPNVLGNTQTYIRVTNASGTTLGNNVLANETNVVDQGQQIIVKVSTFSAGSVTLVGCANTSSTSGTPGLIRDSTREALLLVEDIGAA